MTGSYRQEIYGNSEDHSVGYTLEHVKAHNTVKDEVVVLQQQKTICGSGKNMNMRLHIRQLGIGTTLNGIDLVSLCPL